MSERRYTATVTPTAHTWVDKGPFFRRYPKPITYRNYSVLYHLGALSSGFGTIISAVDDDDARRKVEDELTRRNRTLDVEDNYRAQSFEVSA